MQGYILRMICCNSYRNTKENKKEQIVEMLNTAAQILDQALEEKDNFDDPEEKQDVEDSLNLLVSITNEYADVLLSELNKGWLHD